MGANVLIIDDDLSLSQLLVKTVQRLGHSASFVLTLAEGLERVRTGGYDVVFLDVNLPDGSGLSIIPELRETISAPEVIIITGAGDPDGAELAIRSGAWDYIQKPSSLKAMSLPLMRALEYRKEKRKNRPDVDFRAEGIVARSPRMKGALDQLAQAVDSKANLLITGETGTGKELFALALHRNSGRAQKPFVVVDCASLPETLVESLLFGHEKGSFTGASQVQTGLIKQADGGTLFLDEIGELPLAVQKSFLRVLQEKKFRSIGGSQEVESNFRLVSATNRDLARMVEAGIFREDLFFRIRSICIELPPLRERNGDLSELVGYHLQRLCMSYGIDKKQVSPEFLDLLDEYSWPGNVRELVNTLEMALAASHGEPTLFPLHLPMGLRVKLKRASVASTEQVDAPEEERSEGRPLPSLKDFQEQNEKQYLRELLRIADGNIGEACRISGLSRSRLYARLQKLRLSRKG